MIGPITKELEFCSVYVTAMGNSRTRKKFQRVRRVYYVTRFQQEESRRFTGDHMSVGYTQSSQQDIATCSYGYGID